MKKFKYISYALLLSAMLFFIGCSSEKIESEIQENTGITVVTTLFPQYDFVRQIAKDKANVILLLPPGVEAHSYEPTPRDIVTIENASLFVYTGETMEPWAQKVINTVNSEKLIVVDSSEGLLDPMDHDEESIEHDDDHEDHEDHDDDHDEEHDEHDEEHDEHGHGQDPHIWLDPVKAKEMVGHILAGLIEADPQNTDFYKSNAQVYLLQLDGLHQNINESLMDFEHKEIMVGGHFAFGHFAERYEIEVESAYEGFAPNAEPSPKRIAELIDHMNEMDMRYIYHEELVDPKIAKVIANETKAELLILHGAHNLSKEELESGITYIEIMEGNLERLVIGFKNE